MYPQIESNENPFMNLVNMPGIPERTLLYTHASVYFCRAPYRHHVIGPKGSVIPPQLQNFFVDEGEKHFKGVK